MNKSELEYLIMCIIKYKKYTINENGTINDILNLLIRKYKKLKYI